MKIFITGLHRAGTHSIAQHFSAKHKIFYFEEGRIQWNSFEAVEGMARGYSPKWTEEDELELIRDKHLDKGFSIQCPGLAAKTIELSKLGKVYWATRSHEDVVTSAVNCGIDRMAWDIMKRFRQQFPNDPMWPKLSYDGREDHYSGFAKYNMLLVKVSEYFYETQFKGFAERVSLEDLDLYNSSEALTTIKPLKPHAEKQMREALEENECLRIY